MAPTWGHVLVIWELVEAVLRRVSTNSLAILRGNLGLYKQSLSHSRSPTASGSSGCAPVIVCAVIDYSLTTPARSHVVNVVRRTVSQSHSHCDISVNPGCPGLPVRSNAISILSHDPSFGWCSRRPPRNQVCPYMSSYIPKEYEIAVCGAPGEDRHYPARYKGQLYSERRPVTQASARHPFATGSGTMNSMTTMNS